MPQRDQRSSLQRVSERYAYDEENSPLVQTPKSEELYRDVQRGGVRLSKSYHNISLAIIEQDPQQCLQEATHYVEDAILGVFRSHPLNNRSSQWAWVTHLYLFYLNRLAIWGLVLLTFYQEPVWCLRARYLTENQLPNQFGSSVPNPCESELYPTFFQTGKYLPLMWQQIVELGCLSILTFDFLLQIWAFGGRLFRQVTKSLHMIFLVAAIVDCLVAVLTPQYYFRIAPYMRIGLLTVILNDIHAQLHIIYQILPEFLSIAFLLLCFMALYAWSAMLLFQSDSSEEAEIWFPDFPTSMWNLLVLLTTCNFPDIMMPIYTSNRLFVLFFIPYLIIGLYFLLNMITAIIYNQYQANRNLKFDEKHAAKEESLQIAFKLLDQDSSGELEKQQIFDIFQQLNVNKEIAYISDVRASLVFAAMDRDGNDRLTREEFMTIVEMLTIRFEQYHRVLSFEERFPKLHRNKAFAGFFHFINSQMFDVIVDVILVLNAVLFIWETQSTMSISSTATDRKVDSWNNYLESAFTIFYTVEVVVKVLVYSWKGYWRHFKNKFDFVVTVLSILMTIYVYLPTLLNDSRYIRWILMLRMLRLVRFLATLQSFKIVAKVFVKVMPAATQLALIVFVIMFFFGSVGVELFGGAINLDPTSNTYDKLKQTPFAQPSTRYTYYANNFNDMASAMVTLFELLVVNNWNILVTGYVAIAGQQSLLFFATYYVVSVLICMNLCVSFVIDTAMETYGRIDADDIQGVEAVMQGDVAYFDAERITGTTSGVTGEYMARIPQLVRTRSKNAREILQAVFQLDAQQAKAESEEDVQQPLLRPAGSSVT